MNDSTKWLDICDGCKYCGCGYDVFGSCCFMCKRNPTDHRIDFFKDKVEEEKDD